MLYRPGARGLQDKHSLSLPPASCIGRTRLLEICQNVSVSLSHCATRAFDGPDCVKCGPSFKHNMRTLHAWHECTPVKVSKHSRGRYAVIDAHDIYPGPQGTALRSRRLAIPQLPLLPWLLSHKAPA